GACPKRREASFSRADCRSECERNGSAAKRAPRRSREYGKSAGVSSSSAPLASEVREHGVGRLCAHDLHQLFTRRTPHAGKAAKGGQQQLPPAGPDSVK